MPGIPEAAYLASMPLRSDGTASPPIGVSGGGGDPREARVVEVDAVLLNRFTPAGSGMCSLLCAGILLGVLLLLASGAAPSGGG